MRNHNITLEQKITNAVNQEADFTQKISGSHRDGRYVVATSNVWKGKLPSHEPKMISIITDAVSDALFGGCDSIGGWKDKETGMYYVDMCVHFQYKSEAMEVAIANEEIAIYDLFEEKEIRVEDYIKETLL
tara:strand:+ start:837 stop:1229 length:393 start_codon:yes stop_codon:yes gene_type:complete